MSSATVPMRVTANRPVPELELRGPGGRAVASAILDTGGGGLLLTEALAREVGLTWGEPVEEDGMTVAPAAAPQVWAGDFRFDHGLDEVYVVMGRESVLDVAEAGIFVPGRVLARHHVVFDYPADEFTIGAPGSLTTRGTAIASPLGGTGFPRIEVELGGESVGLLLDTGASASMLSAVLVDRLLAAHPDWPHCVGAVGSAGMGVADLDATATTLRIIDGQWAGSSLAAVIAVSRPPGTYEKYMSPMMSAPIVGALGGDALRRFRVEIDYRAATSYLEPTPWSPGRDAVFGVGLVLGPDQRVTVVSSAHSRTHLAVRAGDVLHSVDGQLVSGQPLYQVQALLAGRVGDERAVVVRRTGEMVDAGRLPVVDLLPWAISVGGGGLADMLATLPASGLRPSPAPADWAPWLRSAAVPLSTDPAAPIDDFAPLRSSLERARVVGLGEGTHGTSEFFAIKHRFVRYLVSELGFTAFAIEGFPAECHVVDEYVRNGVGDPVEAVRMIYGGGFPWDTEEMLAFVQWLRAHNALLPPERRVAFYGFDIHGTGSVLALVETLRGLDSALAIAAEELLTPVGNASRLVAFHQQPEPDREPLRAAVDAMIEQIDTARSASSQIDPRSGWTAARRHVEAIRQVLRVPTGATPIARAPWRERGQAAIVTCLLDLEGPDGKIVTWAHNGHVQRGSDFFHDAPASGTFVAEEIGPAYVVVGAAFHHGGFRAGDRDGAGLTDFTVDGPLDGSFDAALGEVDRSCFVVDLRSAPEGVRLWLDEPMPMRTIGGGFSADPEWPHHVQGVPGRAYDLVVYVRETTPACAVPPLDRPQPETPSVLPELANRDLAAWQDGCPTSWQVDLGGGVLPYELGGALGCVRLGRATRAWAGGSAAMSQLVDATEMRGRTVRLSAQLSATGTDLTSGVRLVVQPMSGPPDALVPLAGEPGPELPVAAEPGWYEFAGVVPDEATAVTIGLRTTGPGWTECTGFALEITD